MSERMRARFCEICVLGLTILSTSASAADWSSATIKGFLSPAGLRIWSADCKDTTGDRLDISQQQTSSISDAEVNEELSCVRFRYRGVVYYARESAVDLESSRHAAAICRKLASSEYGDKVGASMGLGEGCAAPEQKKKPPEKRIDGIARGDIGGAEEKAATAGHPQ